MKLVILEESGYEWALMGMSLSYYDRSIPLHEWWDDEKMQRAEKRAKSLAFKHGGHNKFLESIHVWIYLQASRDVWSEFDTYRAGVTKQSSSTMHTLNKRLATMDDFEIGTEQMAIDNLNNVIAEDKTNITRIKKNLPEGWLQERIICTNYKALQNIIAQRHKHRLKQWPEICDEIIGQVEHPYFLVNHEKN